MKNLRFFIARHGAKLLSSTALMMLGMGTVFYHHFEGWSWVDSFYFSVTTLTTVGFGDLHPTTDLTKIFTALYLFFGIGILLGFLNRMASQTRKLQRINKKIIEELNGLIKR